MCDQIFMMDDPLNPCTLFLFEVISFRKHPQLLKWPFLNPCNVFSTSFPHSHRHKNFLSFLPLWETCGATSRRTVSRPYTWPTALIFFMSECFGSVHQFVEFNKQVDETGWFENDLLPETVGKVVLAGEVQHVGDAPDGVADSKTEVIAEDGLYLLLVVACGVRCHFPGRTATLGSGVSFCCVVGHFFSKDLGQSLSNNTAPLGGIDTVLSTARWPRIFLVDRYSCSVLLDSAKMRNPILKNNNIGRFSFPAL